MDHKTSPNDAPVSWYEDVTPAMAADYLKRNTHNRPLNKKRVDEYAEAMSNDQWHLSHQGIGFSAAGDLIDGQHRLHAVVKSGKTVRMQVTMGLTREAQLVIDTGRARSVAQNVGLMGKTYAKWVTAWANVVHIVLTGTQSRHFNASEIERVYDDLPEAIEAAVAFGKTEINRGSVGAAFLLAYNKNPEKVVEFFKAFCEGSDLAKGSAVHAAHKYYFQSPSRQKDERQDVTVKLLRCIQAHIEGGTVDASHVYVSEQAVSYFADAHKAGTVFGILYAARAIRGK